MAERPDLEYWVPILSKELEGLSIEAIDIDKPVVVRVAMRGDFNSLVLGSKITKVWRRGHFILWDLVKAGAPPLDLALLPMLAGRFRFVLEKEKKLPGDRAVVFHLSDKRRLVYRDDVQMGKIYALGHGDFGSVPGLAKIGVDCLDRKKFSWEVFKKLAGARRDQAKVFLMDKAALDFFGNAYADETLFEARIHPKTFVKKLDEAGLRRLFEAIGAVLSRANKIIDERKPELDVKLRDFLHVRLHAGEPCPRCGTTIRKAGVHGHDAFFCPTCQPDDRGSSIVDWRKLPGSGDGPARNPSGDNEDD